MELVPKGDGGQSPVVLFATPSFDKSVSVDYHTSMISTIVEMHRHGIECDHRLEVGLQFIDLARNKLVDYFLKSDWNFTDLVFIDADQGWDAKVMPRLVSYPQGVVGALPPKKSSAVEPEYHMNAITGVIDPATHLFQSLELGTGCMRIKREIFERMDAAFPELHTDPLGKPVGDPFSWPCTPYFQTGMGKYGWSGEDMFFCRQLVAMGEYAWIDSDVTFTHRGSKAWKGNFYEHCVSTGLLKKGA